MDFEKRLKLAKDRLDRARVALAPKHKGGEVEEYRAAQSELLSAEREAAAHQHEEYAANIAFPVTWDAGAPMPTVLASDYRLFLIFYVQTVDPNWHGTHVTVRRADVTSAQVALVTFDRSVAIRFGSPNDEVLSGHPLYGRGLEPYTAQEVKNSRWLAEIEAMNRVHSNYSPTPWKTRRHFVFWFHDRTFECIAGGYSIEIHQKSLAGVVNEAASKLAV